MNNHFPSLLDNNVRQKVNSRTALVKVALDAVVDDRDSTRITLQKNSYFTQFSSVHLNYIHKIYVIVLAITMNFFRLSKMALFQEINLFKKKFYCY